MVGRGRRRRGGREGGRGRKGGREGGREGKEGREEKKRRGKREKKRASILTCKKLMNRNNLFHRCSPSQRK